MNENLVNELLAITEVMNKEDQIKFLSSMMKETFAKLMKEINKNYKVEVSDRTVKIYNRQQRRIFYKINDMLHNEDGPASIIYNGIGPKKSVETYWIYNLLHRTDGPAYISYKKDGTIDNNGYYIMNAQISEEDFNRVFGK